MILYYNYGDIIEMKRRRDPPNMKLPELENNPLDMFPTNGGTIRRVFSYSKSFKEISRENKEGDKEENSHQQWLSPNKIDPTVSVIICVLYQ